MDALMALQIVRLADIQPESYPTGLEPYPHPESHSQRYGLGVFDLITPDGDRVWVIAGWDDSMRLRAWTVEDFVAGRKPSKVRTDQESSFAPIRLINRSPDLREQFISGYLAERDKSESQVWAFGISDPLNSSDWIGAKIHPYGPNSIEHIVVDCDPHMRLLTVDPVRANKSEDFRRVDIWEVTSSWHLAYTNKLTRRSRSDSSDQQYLYRLFDQDERLLYVGVTQDLFRRWKEHSKQKDWWKQVFKFTQECYPDRASVEAAERDAIKSECPMYNIAHANRGDH
jgi:predicted GIY-YIG superfamily endonuclease